MEEKRGRGRPFGTKKEKVKEHVSFRLSEDVRLVIQSKPNQVQYIEKLVRQDVKNS